MKADIYYKWSCGCVAHVSEINDNMCTYLGVSGCAKHPWYKGMSSDEAPNDGWLGALIIDKTEATILILKNSK